MALNYRRLTEEDIAGMNVLAAGQYEFYVASVEEKKSRGGIDKNGQPKKIYDMLEVELKVYNDSGKERKLKDWVMIVQGDEPMGFKLRHFADTCGLIDKYDAETLEARDFVGKHGVVKIVIKDGVNEFGEPVKRNNVVDYVKPLQMVQSDNNFNDDIPDFT